MPDLVDQYFQEDLTEAEQQALSEFLLVSEEAALKFEALAKESYLRYGHPEPQPKWNDPPSPPSVPGTGWGPWLWTPVVILGLGALYHFLQANQVSSPQKGLVSQAQNQAVLTAYTGLPKAAPVSEKQFTEKKVKNIDLDPGSNNGEKAQGAFQEVSSVSGQRVPLDSEIPTPQLQKAEIPQAAVLSHPVPSAGATPVNLDLNPTKTYSNLSVVVNQSQLGFISVRLTDPRGAEIKRLYLGNLGPGNWVFEWDGKLPNGLAASPGYYQIEVKSGSFIQRKSIQIQ
jgi:hypothetical protein